MCTFTGSFSGDTLEVSNAARVDNEGGEAKNAMQCRWGSKLTLTR